MKREPCLAISNYTWVETAFAIGFESPRYGNAARSGCVDTPPYPAYTDRDRNPIRNISRREDRTASDSAA